MYRRNDNIGCLSVSAYRIGVKPNIIASVIDTIPIVTCNPIGKKLVVTCSLVCTVNKATYLDVKPNYVWLTPDMLSSAEFNVISNTDWIIN